MKKVKLFEQFITESYIEDKKTREFLFESDTFYSAVEFLKICKKSEECKDEIKYNSNFGKGIKAVEFLNKNLSFPIECRVFRSAWNYGGNLQVAITIKGDPGYPHGQWFKYQSADSTRSNHFSFGDIFAGVKEPDGTLFRTGFGIIHGTYKNISKSDEVLNDILFIFKDYKRVNGVEFSPKTASAIAKSNAKITDDWKKLKPKIDKIYNEAWDAAKKVSREIGIKMPQLILKDKEVFYYTNEPRSMRHPDEYGDSAQKILSSKEYTKYEKIQANLSDLLQKFATKHGLRFTWSADNK